MHKPDQDQGEKPAQVQRNEGNTLETGAQKLHGEAKSKEKREQSHRLVLNKRKNESVNDAIGAGRPEVPGRFIEIVER